MYGSIEIYNGSLDVPTWTQIKYTSMTSQLFMHLNLQTYLPSDINCSSEYIGLFAFCEIYEFCIEKKSLTKFILEFY